MEQGNDGSATMKPKRGSWTKEQKRQIVTESHLAGANLAEVAQRHEILEYVPSRFTVIRWPERDTRHRLPTS